MTRRRQPTQFLLPVTGFENDGQPVTPPGFDKEYGLYLTIARRWHIVVVNGYRTVTRERVSFSTLSV